MRALLHCEETDLSQLLKSCIVHMSIDLYGRIITSNYIYLSSNFFFEEPIIIYSFKPIDVEISIVYRRQRFIHICTVKSCKCGYQSEVSTTINVINSRKYRIEKASVVQDSISDIDSYISSVLRIYILKHSTEHFKIYVMNDDILIKYTDMLWDIKNCSITISTDGIYGKRDDCVISIFDSTKIEHMRRFKSLVSAKACCRNYIMLCVNAEAFGFYNDINVDSRRPRLEMNGNDIFAVYNLEPFKIIKNVSYGIRQSIDFMSFTDFANLVYGVNYDYLNYDFAFDITDKMLSIIGVMTDRFNSFYPNVCTSSTINIKSMSRYVSSRLNLTGDQLTDIRFELAQQSMPDRKLYKSNPDLGLWSLCYYWIVKGDIRKPVFIDTSGHTIYSLLLTTQSIFNWASSWRHRTYNIVTARGQRLIKDNMDKCEIDLVKLENLEDRQDFEKYHIWHTYKEDVRACDVATNIIHNFDSFSMLEVKYIKQRLEEFRTDGLLSVPVIHDKIYVDVRKLEGY